MNEPRQPGGRRFALGDLRPTVDPTAWIAPTAVLIGDVRIGPGANIWFNCVLRGDTNPVIIGARSNIQDGTVMHVDHGENPAIVGDDVTVGHAAILHACRIGNHAFIGMGTTVLDGAVVEEGGMLAARGFLGPGKRIGAHEMWMGSPARFVRHMDAAEQARWADTVPHYLGLTALYQNTLTEID
ncbi:gamma carbonic anhydrase family protein [Acidocella sp.]|uniref:gamma carbonic anhydrase family protein n=1 Tax=Acidocella sp. TaxID=50710 RepID=UPI002634351A|nr:gamma carbonic anhydrase family protein [Acidocella sp.]